MTALLPLLTSLLPYLLGIFAAIGGYLFVKNKGVQQERAKQEMAKVEATAKVQAKVTEAISQDAVIDQKVAEQIEEVKKVNTPTDPSRPDRFRF